MKESLNESPAKFNTGGRLANCNGFACMSSAYPHICESPRIEIRFSWKARFVCHDSTANTGADSGKSLSQRCIFNTKCLHGKQILPHMKIYLLRLGDIWEYSKSILHLCSQNIGQQSTYSTERNLLFAERICYRKAQWNVTKLRKASSSSASK